jgi:predicted metal-dependent hydrolase
LRAAHHTGRLEVILNDTSQENFCIRAEQHTAAFRRGIKEFNTGRFFEAHETWEEIWLASAEPERTFLQGIIQIAAAFHHYSRANTRGARSLLEAGLRRLAPFPAVYRGIALDPLRASAASWAAALSADESVPENPPRIDLIETAL